MAKITKDDIIATIKEMTLLEVADLVKAIETEFGVSAAAPVSAAPTAAAAAPVEEKTEFDVILKDAGASKINVIKVVRAITGLGLKEAKDLVDAPPKPVKTGVSKDEAEKVMKELTDAGATVELK